MTDQRPAGIFQRDNRVPVIFKKLADQRACQGGITAAGTSLAGATALELDLCEVTSGTGGVRLPGALHGRQVFVKNVAGVTLTVYPQSTDQIDALGTAVGYSLSSAGAVIMTAVIDNQWYSLKGA